MKLIKVYHGSKLQNFDASYFVSPRYKLMVLFASSNLKLAANYANSHSTGALYSFEIPKPTLDIDFEFKDTYSSHSFRTLIYKNIANHKIIRFKNCFDSPNIKKTAGIYADIYVISDFDLISNIQRL